MINEVLVLNHLPGDRGRVCYCANATSENKIGNNQLKQNKPLLPSNKLTTGLLPHEPVHNQDRPQVYIVIMYATSFPRTF